MLFDAFEIEISPQKLTDYLLNSEHPRRVEQGKILSAARFFNGCGCSRLAR
jgi:hypothetical protein